MLRTFERNLELTNRNLKTPVVPQIRPRVFVHTRTVLAGKGPLRRTQRALAPPRGSDLTTVLGGSDGNNCRE